MMPDALDIVGDIHGQRGKLAALLAALGYSQVDGTWRHPERRVAFVGDFVDRGPEQLATYRLVRGMVEAGSALAVMGNHEFNAIAFYMPDGGRPPATALGQEPQAARRLSVRGRERSGSSPRDRRLVRRTAALARSAGLPDRARLLA